MSSPLTTEIRFFNNAPALFINGKPDSGLMFYVTHHERNADEIAEFGKAGVHLHSGAVNMGRCMRKDGGCDFAPMDALMSTFVEADPQALVLPRVGLVPPDWWMEKHPDAQMRHYDPATGEFTERSPAKVSFTCREWLDEMARVLDAFMRYTEQRWGEHVLGYHLCAGDCGEWSYDWSTICSDYSRANTEAYRRWLRGRYAGQERALQQAWGDPDAAFEGVEIPTDRIRRMVHFADNVRDAQSGCVVLDPARDRRLIDYQTFMSEAVGDAILHFSRAAKGTLRSIGRAKICGVFYGYHIWGVNRANWFHNSGHHDLVRVLESPDVDFICAPYTYSERHPGGMFASQVAMGSMRARCKLFYSEDDSRTFLAKAGDVTLPPAPNLRVTVGVLRRNLAGAITAGATQWWMDLPGDGWYRDAELMKSVAGMRRLGEECLQADRSPAAQVAFVLSKRTAPFLRYDDAITDSLHAGQVSELSHAGVPFDTYLAEDIDLVFSQPWSRVYRLVIFGDAFCLSDGERRAIREKVARAGRTLVWIHAAGMITPGGLSPEAAAELTGIRARMIGFGDAPLVETGLGGTRVQYGPERVLRPLLAGDDPSADVAGWLLRPISPGLLVKQMDGWRSIWSAAPGMPSSLLRAICREAGVHVYGDAGDQVFAGCGILAIHAAWSGARTIHLPSRCTLRDAFANDVVAEKTDSVTVEMERGDTEVWKVEGC